MGTASFGILGLLGNAGGDSSPKLAEPLLGGLLKGDTFSEIFARATSTAASPSHDNLLGRGLSKLGRVLVSSRCLRSSADLRGGGGEGGLKAGFATGDLPRSMLTGRPGILNCLPGTGEAVGLTTSSGFNRPWSFAATCGELPFGGECGGSTVSSGAPGIGRGVSGGGGKALRAGERMMPFCLRGGGARPGFFGIGGGSFAVMVAVAGALVFDSRGLSGRGLGEAFRLEGWAGWAGCACCAGGRSLPMFSKCDKREETGFCWGISHLRTGGSSRQTG